MKQTRSKASFLRPSDSSGAPMRGIVAPTASYAVPELKTWEDRLGLFDRMRLSAMTRREVSTYLGEVFINRMKAAKEVQLARDAHWVEEQKEIEYLASQQRMSAVEKEMTISATEFVDSLLDSCFEFNLGYWQKKAARLERLKDLLDRKLISQDSYDAGLADVDEFADAQCRDVKDRVNAVLTRMRDRFDRALTLFEEHPAH